MSSMPARSKDVGEALVEPLTVMAGSQTEAFAELYERTFPRVYAYVASLLRDRAAAEDVTAQAFERAYRKRRSYRAGRGTHGGVAVRDRAQRRARRAAQAQAPAGLDGDPEDTGAPDPDDHAELALRRQTVRAALASLDGRERDLIALKFAGGLSNAEIGRILGMSESNAGTDSPDHHEAARGMP